MDVALIAIAVCPVDAASLLPAGYLISRASGKRPSMQRQ
jgi:hypothetical protein